MMDELLFLMNDRRWPNWPILPVIHRTAKDDDGMSKAGIVLALDDFKNVVFEINMFEINASDMKELAALGNRVVTHRYETPMALLDHWRID